MIEKFKLFSMRRFKTYLERKSSPRSSRCTLYGVFVIPSDHPISNASFEDDTIPKLPDLLAPVPFPSGLFDATLQLALLFLDSNPDNVLRRRSSGRSPLGFVNNDLNRCETFLAESIIPVAHINQPVAIFSVKLFGLAMGRGYSSSIFT